MGVGFSAKVCFPSYLTLNIPSFLISTPSCGHKSMHDPSNRRYLMLLKSSHVKITSPESDMSGSFGDGAEGETARLGTRNGDGGNEIVFGGGFSIPGAIQFCPVILTP